MINQAMKTSHRPAETLNHDSFLLMTNKKSFLRIALLAGSLVSAAFIGALPASAGGPVVWETNTRAALLAGDARGVSVTDPGALMLPPRFPQLYDTEQAFVWSSAADSAGHVYPR